MSSAARFAEATRMSSNLTSVRRSARSPPPRPSTDGAEIDLVDRVDRARPPPAGPRAPRAPAASAT